MTSQLYKDKRKSLGYTQTELAAALDVRQATISVRESGGEITREAWLAIHALPKKRKAKNVV